MEYKCTRCGYTTNRSNNLKKHLANKIICKPILENIDRQTIYDSIFNKNYKFECEFCNKTYKTRDVLNKHKLKFHKNEISKKDSVNETNELLKQIITILQSKNENKELTNINITTNNNIVTNNNLNVQYNFLKDSYIMNCARKMDSGLIDFIKSIRFNPDHPENMNVKLHTKRDKTLYVYKNEKWEICDAKWTLEEMIIHGAKIIYQKFLSNSDQEKLLEDGSAESIIQTWLLSILPRNNEKIMGRISKRLYAIILNNQNLLVVEEPINEDGGEDGFELKSVNEFM